MVASNQIFLVVDASTPVAVFTARQELKAYLKRAFNRPLVYRIDSEGHAPTIMTMSRAMSE